MYAGYASRLQFCTRLRWCNQGEDRPSASVDQEYALRRFAGYNDPYGVEWNNARVVTANYQVSTASLTECVVFHVL